MSQYLMRIKKDIITIRLLMMVKKCRILIRCFCFKCFGHETRRTIYKLYPHKYIDQGDNNYTHTKLVINDTDQNISNRIYLKKDNANSSDNKALDIFNKRERERASIHKHSAHKQLSRLI